MRLMLTGAVAVAGLMSAPVLAADHAFEITNLTDFDLVAVHVQNGKVNDFKIVRANGERQFTLSLPDGTCTTQLNFVFNDSDAIVVNNYDACNGGGMNLSY